MTRALGGGGGVQRRRINNIQNSFSGRISQEPRPAARSRWYVLSRLLRVDYGFDVWTFQRGRLLDCFNEWLALQLQYDIGAAVTFY